MPGGTVFVLHLNAIMSGIQLAKVETPIRFDFTLEDRGRLAPARDVGMEGDEPGGAIRANRRIKIEVQRGKRLEYQVIER